MIRAFGHLRGGLAYGLAHSAGGHIFIHAKSDTRSKLFELAHLVQPTLPKGSIAKFTDVYSFVFQNGRDLSGFIDGTENAPDEDTRFKVAVNKDTGESFCIAQRWIHDLQKFNRTKDSVLEGMIGRARSDSTELKKKLATSHVARMTSGPAFGVPKPVQIAMPYWTVGGESGLFFIGFADQPSNFDYMLDKIVGATDDKLSDEVMRFGNGDPEEKPPAQPEWDPPAPPNVPESPEEPLDPPPIVQPEPEPEQPEQLPPPQPGFEPDMRAQFVTFLNRAVSPFHAVEECSRLLKSAGFNELKEADSWQLKPMNKYFVTRNKSTVIAFAVGGKFVPGNGLSIVAAHTDSPNLRVKPVSKLSSGGCLQVGVIPYGGGLWRTWFDRDLTVAGRVVVKDYAGKLSQRLVHIEKPIMCIPNLAIHLDGESNDKFVHNKEDHLKPILATVVAEKLNEEKDTNSEEKSKSETASEEIPGDISPDHHSIFLNLVAEKLGVKISENVDFELCVIDFEPARIGGLNEEFIFGARLDNLDGTYSAITGLIESLAEADALNNDTSIRVAACYDNEECGSESAQGAASSLTEWIFRRLNSPSTFGSNAAGHTLFEESIAKSYLISADQANAIHPNYKGKYEDNHGPMFHKGIVIKIHPNQRYGTTSLTRAILKQVAAKAEVPSQKFIVHT